MKNILIIFVILFSLISAEAAELSCLCFSDSTSHSNSQDSVKKADHHKHQDESASDHQDHCQHTCSQCHFAAVVPRFSYFTGTHSQIQVNYIHSDKSPIAVSLSLYRPPIS